jgi:HK97 family phage major capsid protein
MTARLIELLTEKRTTAFNSAKAILDIAQAANRQLTAEERSAFDKANADVDAHEADIQIEKEREARSAAYDGLRSTRPSYVSIGSPEDGDAQGKTFRFIPSLAEYRAQTEGGNGSFLVPTQQYPELLRYLATKTVVLAARPRVVPMSYETLFLPRITAGTTAALTAEAAMMTETDPTYNRIALNAKRYTVFTQLSHELVSDSSPEALAGVSQDMLGQLGRLLDQQFLAGTGTGSPAQMLGIRNSGGLVTPLAANGATITLDNVADGIGRLEAGNGDLSTAAIFCDARTWGTLRKAKAVGSGQYFIAPDPSQAEHRSLFGLPVFISNAISNTETVGTSSNCSWLGIVDMQQVVIGQREVPTPELSVDFAFQNDLVSVKVRARYDIGYNDVNGIQILSGILP